MKNEFYFLCLLLLLACKNDVVQNYNDRTFDPSVFNEKLKGGLTRDSLVFYLEQLTITDTQKLSDSIKAEFSYVKSRYHNRLQNYDSAIFNLNVAISYSKNSIESNKEVLYFRALMETYYRYKNDYLNGLGTSEKLYNLLPENDYGNKAMVFNFRQRVKTSLSEHREALDANEKASQNFLLAKDTTNFVMSQISRAGIYYATNEYNKAIALLREASKMEHHLNTSGKNLLYGTLAVYEYQEKEYQNALISFKKALEYSKKLPPHLRKTRMANNYINLSNVFLELKEIDKSKSYIDSVFALGIDNIEYQNQKEALRTKLEITFEDRKELPDLFIKLDSIFKYQEKSYDSRINSELVSLKESFAKEKELEAQKNKAELQSQQRKYMLFILGLMAILAIILIQYINRQRKFKIEKANFLLQQRLLRSQMNPHFIFNSLSLIKDGIEKDKKRSAGYIVRFSRLLRSVFENSTQDYVLLDDEVQSIEDYLSLQQFRFPDRFEYIINNQVPEDEFHIPPMLIQPFVENAIIHGFKNMDTKGNLNIELAFVDAYVLCTVENNGTGINKGKIRPNSSITLIDQFLKKITGKGVMIINKQEQGSETSGTKIQLTIPFKN